MKTIKNLSEENLKAIASELNGKLWIKYDKIRIYVHGGNNYQYNGKWYYEISEEGTWEAKCYLTEGYNNKNRESYVKKYIREMESEMTNFLTTGDKFEESIPETETKEGIEEKAVEEYHGEDANFGESQYDYPSNFYNGCGSYYLAFNGEKLVASVNFTSNMFCDESKQNDYFCKQITEKGVEYTNIIAADGSGCTFFARKSEDVSFLKTKEYFVPKYGGGKHKNIELILK